MASAIKCLFFKCWQFEGQLCLYQFSENVYQLSIFDFFKKITLNDFSSTCSITWWMKLSFFFFFLPDIELLFKILAWFLHLLIQHFAKMIFVCVIKLLPSLLLKFLAFSFQVFQPTLVWNKFLLNCRHHFCQMDITIS